MPDIQVTMIMPVAAVAAANKIANILNVEEGGYHTFEVCRLSANAQEPASHVGAACLVCEETVPLLYDAAALYATLVPLAAQRDRECPTLAECELAVSSAILLPNLEPLSAIQAQGLQVVEVPV